MPLWLGRVFRRRDTRRVMSRENVEVVRAWIEHFARTGEHDLGLFDPGVEWVPLRAAIEGAYHGHAGMLAFQAQTSEAWEKYDLDFEMRDLGEHVLVWGTVRTRAKSSGIEMDGQLATIMEFRGGKIARGRTFGSQDEALKAVGLG